MYISSNNAVITPTVTSGTNTWPLIVRGYFYVDSANMEDCSKAAALADWIYWIRTSSTANDTANAYFATTATGPAASSSSNLLQFLHDFTCNGDHVYSDWSCINDGLLCSNNGVCSSGVCVCTSGWDGTYCGQSTVTLSSSSSVDTLAIVLGVVLPFAFILLLILTCAGAFLLFLHFKKNKKETW